jgi:hypothetical protein
MSRPQRVALIGPGQQGNLALDYLAAAAEANGHAASVIRFDSRRDIDRCTDDVLTMNPTLVGLGIAFQYAIEDYIALAKKLRLAGFRGHITCGGHVPTFCYRELLTDVPAIDSVVRHEGEETLKEMLETMSQGSAPSEMPGLVWREDGQVTVGPPRRPVRDLDTLAPPKRHPRPYVVGGLGTAFLIASRGCVGECAYCSIRAFSREAGSHPYRMRRVEQVADELAALFHDHGVRIIVVQDDLFILPDENKTVDRLTSLKDALAQRDVGRLVFWVKGRPEVITPKVLAASRDLGVAHLFLGVENASLERLRYLGRVHIPEDNARALALSREFGIQTSFNAMLFDPDCTIGDVRANLDFLAAHADITWNICRTEIYSGTELHRRLAAAGRLTGDYKTYGYTMRDSTAEVMFRILRVCFYDRAFDCNSILNKLITLSFAKKIHQTLIPGARTDRTGEQIDALVREVYEDTVAELWRIMDFAAHTEISNLEANRQFAIDAALAINERDAVWRNEIDALTDLLDARGARFRKEQERPPRVAHLS